MSLDRLEINNCVNCILESRFDLVRALFSNRRYCQHKIFFKTTRTYSKMSKPFLIWNIFSLLCFIFPWYTYIAYLPLACESDKNFCLVYLGELIFATVTLFMACVGLTQLKFEVTEFNSWAMMSEKRKFFGLKHIMSLTQFKHLILTREFVLALNVITSVLSILLYYTLSYDNLPWNQYRKFLQVACYSLQYYIGIDLVIRIRMIGSILENFFQTLRNTLLNNRYPIFVRDSKSVSLETVLKRYTRLILTINKNNKLMMKYMSLIFFTYYLTVATSLILNLYVLIEFGDYSIYILFAVEFRTVSTITRIIGVFVIAEECLNRKVSF
jgi:hypothetical protein